MNPWIALVVAAAALAACGKEEPPRPLDPGTRMERAAKDMEAATRRGDVQQAGEAMKEMGAALTGSIKVEPVDFRKLKELLPESIAGLKMKNSEGSRTNVMGFASSKAEATYEDGKGGRIVLEITDAGTLSAVTAMALSWINIDIDKEGDSGYERTTTVSGRKTHERFDRATRTGEFDALAAGRFIVSAKSTGVDLKVFKEAVKGLDLAKLEALKAQGVPSAPVAGK